MGILDEDVARVREATDLVALVGEHLALKRVGRRYVGLCPFHQEKTPSFYVNPEIGVYHCFGCQASGDAITLRARDRAPRLRRTPSNGSLSRAGHHAPLRRPAAPARTQSRQTRLREVVDAAIDVLPPRC